MFCFITKYKDKGAIEKATEEAAKLEPVEPQIMQAGKHRKGPVNWNPRPDLEFSHAVNDGSKDGLTALVEQIWLKYDSDSDGKIDLQEA